MKDTIKSALKWGIVILPIALVGSLFTGMYTFEHYDEATRELILSQIGIYNMSSCNSIIVRGPDTGYSV